MTLNSDDAFRFGEAAPPPPTAIERLETMLTEVLEPHLAGGRGADHARATLEGWPGGGLLILLEPTTVEGRQAIQRLLDEATARVHSAWEPAG